MTKASVTIDVVIPTWNKVDLVLGCLASLRDQAPHHVIVVDNGSTDGTVERVRADFPDVTVIALPENVGFGRAVNRGIEAGAGEIVVLLNNDVLACDGFVADITAPFAEPRVGSVSGVMLTADGRAVDSAGLVTDAGLAGYSHLHGMSAEGLDEGEAPLPEPLGPCGGAAAYRRVELEAVGCFDEEIFAYSEDLDLAIRLDARGSLSRLAPKARVLHLGSATLGAGSAAQLRLSGWARGYVLGRYRVRLDWVVLELVVGLVLSLQTRTVTPVSARLSGLRRGRSLPRRRVGPHRPAVGFREGLRRRRFAARAQDPEVVRGRPLSVAIEPGHDIDLEAWRADYERGSRSDVTPYGLDRMADLPGITVRTLSTPRPLVPALARLLHSSRMDVAALTHGRLRDVDVLITQHEKRGLPALLLGALPGSPKIVTGLIWLTDDTADVPGPASRILRAALRRADGVFVLSRPQVDVLRRWGIAAERIHYVPFGVNAEFWTPDDDVKVEHGLIATAGSDRDRDNDTLLDALSRLRAHGADVRLELAGPPRANLPAGATALGSLTHERLRDLYRRAEVVVIPTRPNLHGSGMTAVLEAMSCGRAVIATETEGMDGYVESGVSGILLPPKDPAALADTLGDLLADPERRARLGAAARERVLRCHSAQTYAAGLADVARSVATRR